MFRTKVSNNIKTNILFLTRLFPESRVESETTREKDGTALQDTHVDVTRRVRFACWITEATNTCLEYSIQGC